MVGFLTVLLSSFIFTFQNIIVRVLFNEYLVLSVFLVGGYVEPTFENSFLLMFMRMLIAVPLMGGVGLRVYPQAMQEFTKLGRSPYRATMIQAIAAGFLMFGYLAFLYISLGLIPAGISMTLFFTYPVFTALLSWRFFGDRPTSFRWAIMAIILLGSALATPQSAITSNNILFGVIASVASGIIYAVYAVVAQKCVAQLHPFVFTWISFAVTLVLSGLCLLIWQIHTLQLDWTPLWIGGLLSGLVSFSGHTLNNSGIRMIGATTAAMIGASNPALTAVIAWIVIQESLDLVQILGIVVVTLGIVLLSGERAWVKKCRN